jgi:hypothetical protein
MNTPHCNGKLTVKATETLDNLIAENGDTIAQWVEYNNATRLALVWNACLKIPSEDLEAFVGFGVFEQAGAVQKHIEDLQAKLDDTLSLLDHAIKARDESKGKNALLRTANAHLSGCLEGMLKGLENFDELQMVRKNIENVLAHVREQAEREKEGKE